MTLAEPGSSSLPAFCSHPGLNDSGRAREQPSSIRKTGRNFPDLFIVLTVWYIIELTLICTVYV